LLSGLGGDDDGTVSGQRAIERSGCRTLEYRHRLDVFGVQVAHTATEIHRRVTIGIIASRPGDIATRIDRHSVHNDECLVIVIVERPVTTQGYPDGAQWPHAGIDHAHARHLAVEVVEPVSAHRGIDIVAGEPPHRVAERLLLP